MKKLEEEEQYLRGTVADLRLHGYYRLADILETEIEKSFAVLRIVAREPDSVGNPTFDDDLKKSGLSSTNDSPDRT